MGKLVFFVFYLLLGLAMCYHEIGNRKTFLVPTTHAVLKFCCVFGGTKISNAVSIEGNPR